MTRALLAVMWRPLHLERTAVQASGGQRIQTFILCMALLFIIREGCWLSLRTCIWSVFSRFGHTNRKNVMAGLCCRYVKTCNL